MKLLHCTVFLFLVYFNVKAVSNYKKGDKIYAWNIAGLQMRNTPSIKSPLLKNIEYGSVVEIIDDQLNQKPLLNKIFKAQKGKEDFILKGFWVKVRYKNIEGYVFDYYLSTLQPFKITQNHKFEDLKSYLQRVFGNPIFTHKETNKKYGGYENYYTYNKNKVTLKETSFDGCFDTVVQMDNISLEESYLIFKTIFYSSDDSDAKFIGKQGKDFQFQVSRVESCGISKTKNGLFEIYYGGCS